MAYNQQPAGNVRELIAVTLTSVTEKAMFGGCYFMVNVKRCVGVEKSK
jgi:hypothetical protein